MAGMLETVCTPVKVSYGIFNGAHRRKTSGSLLYKVTVTLPNPNGYVGVAGFKEDGVRV